MHFIADENIRNCSFGALFREEDIQFQLVWERAPLRGISHATLLVIEEEEEEAGID